MVFIHKHKKELTEKFVSFLNKLNSTRKSVKISFCDNTGEKKTLEDDCDKHFEEIYFLFTSLSTPEKNSMAEQRFSTFYSHMRGMRTHTGLHYNLDTVLCPECT